jgi:hypothetical protein
MQSKNIYTHVMSDGKCSFIRESYLVADVVNKRYISWITTEILLNIISICL